MYQIIINNKVVVENFIPTQKLQKTLDWWINESGMKGTFTICKEHFLAKKSITLARFK